MEPADLLITPRWLLPIAPANVALEGQAVAISAGRIAAVGPVAQLESRFDARERICRGSHALWPGFVNAHTRASMVLMRGLRVHAPVLRWLRETVAPAETLVSPDFVREGTQLAIAEMLCAGITTFSDSYLFPEEAARAAAEARMRAAIGLPVSETAESSDSAAHLDRAAQLWDDYRADPWVSLYFALPAPYAVGDPALARLRIVADELDARISMPVHETALEVQDSVSQHGMRPLQRLEKLGLLRPGFTALHMNHVEPADIELARTAGLSVVACPQADLRLGSGSCAVAALLRSGVPFGLGSDSPAASGAFDMLAEARLAALLSGSDGGISAADALCAATLGGAIALGLGGTCGSIEPGKSADLICIDLASLPCESFASVADAVLFGATRREITDVWTGGRAALSESQLLAFDERELARQARQWAERVQSGVTP
jgi:5-methylthioadenosine/S-adenosylhomocysteine deaminase